MKTFKKILVIALLLTSSIYIYSQTMHSSIKNKIDVNEKNGKIRAVYNIYEKQAGSSSDERAKNYLKKNKNMFGLQNDLNDLVLTVNKESMGTKHINYKQFYKGIAVMNSNVTVSFNKDDFITMVVCDYFPIKDLSIVENINETTANNLTRAQIKNVNNDDITFRSSKKIYIDENLKPHLIWDILAYVKKAPYEIYYVDAHTGEIIQKKSAGFGYVTGSGQVFNPDPGSYLRDSTLNSSSNISSAYKSESLPNLSGNGYLQGQYAYSTSYLGNENIVYNSNNNFNFTRTQLGFKETNAYYFIDKFLTYIHNLGFSFHWQESESSALCFDATVPFVISCNACEYWPTNDAEYIVMGYDYFDPNPITGSEDESVIIHESGHALHDALINGGITEAPSGGTAIGISEGIADYIGISFRRSLQPSNPFRPNARCNYFYDCSNSPGIRDINSANYSLWSSSNDRGKASIWSSTLMDIEYDVATNPGQGTNLGRDKTTKLLLKSLSYINETSTIADYINAMFQADRDLYNGTDLAALEDVYRNRGFLSGYEASGTISQNTTWSSYMVVTGDVTVASGVTLTISPDTFVYFDSNTEMIIYGTLVADGTSSEPITFTRNGSTGTWDGINFQSSGSGTIDNCIISNAQTALSLGGTSSVEITNNFIHDNTQNGIFLNMSSPDISNNQIRNNGYYGIWAQNESAPSITNNIITGNSYAGIYSDLYSTIGSAYGSQGSNAIRSNSYGMISNYNSEDYFGYSGNGGSNSICGNSGYEVTATSNSYVIVQGNWWGSNPPNASEFYADGTSYIDRSSPLSSDPNPTMQKINSLAVNTPGLDVTQSLTIDWESFFDADIMEAMQSFFAGNYQDASNKFEKKFNKEKDVKKKKYVLAKISQCYLKMGSKGFIDYLNNNVRPTLSKNDELFAVALELEYLSFFREGKFESAVNNLNNIKDNFSTNEEMYKHSLFNLSFVYGKYLNNINKAKEYLVELETKFPNDRLVLNGKVLILGEDPVNFSNKDQFRIASSSTSNSEQFELLNYPNPFNPSTTISYTIPEDGKVQIKVFDILGREVTTLVNEFTSAGKHNVVWDGANFASGIYFCNILFKEQILNKKMLLVK